MPIDQPDRAAQRRPLKVAALVAVAAAGAAALWLGLAKRAAFAPGPSSPRGAALFNGGLTLAARMVGHETDLPALATRCSNCHASLEVRATSGASGSAPVDTLGPVLTHQSLTVKQPRRGGPPSSYSEQSFCRVLRDGIDPASVMIPQTMPRYRLTEEECSDLWTHVTSR